MLAAKEFIIGGSVGLGIVVVIILIVHCIVEGRDSILGRWWEKIETLYLSFFSNKNRAQMLVIKAEKRLYQRALNECLAEIMENATSGHQSMVFNLDNYFYSQSSTFSQYIIDGLIKRNYNVERVPNKNQIKINWKTDRKCLTDKLSKI